MFITLFPALISSTRFSSLSNPKTVNPWLANSNPSGIPTYPIPIIPILAFLLFILLMSFSLILDILTPKLEGRGINYVIFQSSIQIRQKMLPNCIPVR